MSGWDGASEPAPLSVEEELKIQQVQLDRKSLTRQSLERKSSEGGVEEKHAMLLKVAEKQHQDDQGPVGVAPPVLARRSSGPPILARKSAPVMKVKIRGHKGATVVLESEPVTPGGAETPQGEEDEELDLKKTKDKWWRKLSSSALNELEREPADGSGPSSYVPQFDLTGANPYVHEVETK